MTVNEKKQSELVFVNAGKKAYHMLIFISNNPYTEQPYRELWEKGYRRAKRDFEAAAIARKNKELFGDNPPPAKPVARPVQRTPRTAPQVRPKQRVSKGVVNADLRNARPSVRIPNKPYRTGTIGDYVAGTVQRSVVGPFNDGKPRKVN